MSASAAEIERDGSIATLSHAAAWRLAEAEGLEDQGRRTAAVYLYGYVVEIRLVAAVLRVAGYSQDDLISPAQIDGLRRDARANNLMSSNPHDLAGWGRYLVFLRAQMSSRLDRKLSQEVQIQSATLYDHWRPRLRYKTLVPTAAQLKAVRDVVAWFEENHSRLWS